MRKVAKIIGIIAGVVLVIVIIAALASPREPVNNVFQLDSAVSNGASIQEVYNLMSPEFQNEAMKLPALSIEEILEGNWHFVPKDNAEIGDTDAPYVVMAIPEDNDFLILFFHNDQLFDKAWFDYTSGWNIIDKLWTTQQK